MIETVQTSKIYPNVILGTGASIGDYCVIGCPPRGYQPGELQTVIGANAIIRSHTVIYAGNVIGEDFQTGHGVTIRELNEIGNDVSVGTSSIVEHHTKIGNGVRMHGFCGIAEFSVLEDQCWLGPSVLLTNTPHPTCRNAKTCVRGPTVGKGAIIAARATLAPGVVVGERAFVGLGCNVIRDVPPHKVVFGNPPRIIREIEELTCPVDMVTRCYQP